ncbi:MAG: AGE family epimerase/isomerase [Candidatus Shapirobacteria bacterium]|jgi:mannobiose 2-epimerase
MKSINCQTTEWIYGFKKELTENILPYWIEKMQDFEHGGFYGRIDGNDVIYQEANKGAILHARILWTFSAAYRILGNNEYRDVAQRALDYIESHFIDKEYGGTFWELDYMGNPENTKKQMYAQGFMLYGFSEFYRATGSEKALAMAVDTFRLIEKYKDSEYGGYPEAFTRDWEPISDMRLSEKDANERKTMNTHLHILEPYTNLLRIWRHEDIMNAQRDLISIFIDKIIDSESYHLNLFFNDFWEVKSSAISYGHDIEASWLLTEAAEVLGENGLLERVNEISSKIAKAAAEGLDSDGGLNYEKEDTVIDREKHWWVQAEAVVGFYSLYQNIKDTTYLDLAFRIWSYIQNHLIDKTNGEWYWSIKPDGMPNLVDDKAGFWKCPYHNGRMCMEMMERIK